MFHDNHPTTPGNKKLPYLHRIIIGNIYQLNIIIADYFTYNLPQKLQNFSYIPGIFKPPPIWQRNVNNINMLASIWLAFSRLREVLNAVFRHPHFQISASPKYQCESFSLLLSFNNLQHFWSKISHIPCPSR